MDKDRGEDKVGEHEKDGGKTLFEQTRERRERRCLRRFLGKGGRHASESDRRGDEMFQIKS